MNIKATAKQIMSAMQSDAFGLEACKKIIHAALEALERSRDFYKRRCDALQRVQSKMRDPERKWVCEILANGQTWGVPIAAQPKPESSWPRKTAELSRGWGARKTKKELFEGLFDITSATSPVRKWKDAALSALAAIEKKDEALSLCTGISSIPLDYGFTVGPEFDPARKKATEARNINVDLSALREHDEKIWNDAFSAGADSMKGNARFLREDEIAEVRKPLVDLVEEAYKEGREDGCDSIAVTDEYNDERWQDSEAKSKLDALAKIPKMKKEPKYVAETLAWCNERRKEQGKRPLKKMPKGIIADPDSCPCGKAANVSVYGFTWRPVGYPVWAKEPLPKCVKQFVAAFDNERLPQYIE